jgi:hypothetical protein
MIKSSLNSNYSAELLIVVVNVAIARVHFCPA